LQALEKILKVEGYLQNVCCGRAWKHALALQNVCYRALPLEPAERGPGPCRTSAVDVPGSMP